MPEKVRNLLAAAEAWRIASADPFDRSGDVKIRAGHLAMAAGDPGSGAVYRGPLPRIDYRLEIQARRTDGQDFFCGLTFPVHDEHATLIIGGWGGGVTGISNIDGMPAIENETTSYTPFENGRWYEIDLQVTASRITAAIDGKEILNVNAKGRRFNVWPEMEPMRPLGIATWNSDAEIRQVHLTAVRA